MLSNLKLQLDSARGEVHAVLASRDSSRQALRAQVSQLQAQLSSSTSQAKMLKQKVSSSKLVTDTLEKELQTLTEDITELRTRVNNQEMTVEDFNKERMAALELAEGLAVKLDVYRCDKAAWADQAAEMKVQLEQAQAEKVAAVQKLGIVEEKMLQEAIQHAAARCQVELLAQVLLNTRQQLHQREVQLLETTGTLQEQKLAAKAAQRLLQESQADHQAALQKLSAQLQEMEQAKETAESQAKQHLQKVEQLQAQAEASAGEQQQQSQLEKELAQQAAQKQLLQLQQLLQVKQGLEDNIKGLQQELQLCQATCGDLTQKLVKLEAAAPSAAEMYAVCDLQVQ